MIHFVFICLLLLFSNLIYYASLIYYILYINYYYNMKYIAIVFVLIAAYFLEVSAMRFAKASPDESQAAEADIDALMDKYDEKEKAD